MNRHLIKALCLYALVHFIPICGETHDFVGHHLLASYLDCDQRALANIESLETIFKEAVNVSGAKILSSSKHVFEPDGLTMVILLSESHASIHTYPEYGACFVDFFTCGNNCDASKFESVLKEYLQPAQVASRLVHRHQDIEIEQ